MRNYFFIPLLSLLVLASCRFKPKDGLNFEQNLVTPLVKSSINIGDVLADSSIVQVNSDNSMKVVYRDTLADLSLSDYLVVPDTSVGSKITLDSLSLATDTLEQDLTLAQMGHALQDAGDPAGDLILNNHGNFIPWIQDITGQSSPDIAINAAEFFEEADLISGQMVVEIINNLPVAVSNVVFNLRNDTILFDTLVKKAIAVIPPGQTGIDSASLAGKTVYSKMAGQLENLDLTAPFLQSILIDTFDYVRIRVIVKDLGASRATAIFPGQRVLDDFSRIKYEFGDDLAITRFRVESGQLRIRAFSTIQDTIEFSYTLPTAIKDGLPVTVQERLIPDTVADTAGANIVFELEDYYIDLTINGDSINLFPYHLTGDLLYSGVKQTMDLSDEIDVFYGLFEIKPSYIEGYLGKQLFSFVDSLDLDFFSAIQSGSIALENPEVSLTILNSIGVDGEMNINDLKGYNSRTGQTISLNGSAATSPIEVLGPRLPNVGQTLTTKIDLNSSNSNIADLLSLLPDRIEFDLGVEVNKYGNPGLRDNFATNASRISAFLDMEVPLHGVADQLTLQDTVALDISEGTLPTGILGGELNMVVSNDFPFEAAVQMYFRDAGGNVVDSLFTGGTQVVPAGQIDQNGIVQVSGEAVLSAAFDKERLDIIRLRSTEAIVRFSLTTKPDGTPVKIYTNYGIDFHLVGDFNYNVDL